MVTERKGKRILGMLLALLLVFNAVLQGGWSVLAAAKVVDIDITKFEIQNKDRQTVDKIFFTDEFLLMMQWDATKNGANIHEGDYFDVKLPDKMQFPSDTTARDFDLTDEHGVVLAKAHVTPGPGDVGGSIHVVFTDKVENKYNVKGTMYLAARFDREKVLKDEVNNFTITVNSDVVGMEQSGTDGVIITGPKELVNEYLNKWGGKIQGDPNQVGWHVRINHTKANLTNMVVTDTLSLPNEKFIPESFSLRQVTFNKYGDIVTGSEVAVDLTGKLTFEAENKTFKLNLGNVTGQQYYFEYNSTYTPGTKLSNKLTLSSTEKNDERVASYQVAQSGGTAGGDLASKIKLIKQDAEDGNIVLANAVFTVTKPDNTTFELTTGADGTVISGILEQGTYKVKEKTPPYGYELNDEEFTLNVSPAGGAIQTVTDKPIKINVEGTKTWDDANNQDGKRPTKIKVNLWADGTQVKEQEVQADGDGNWKYSFTNLRKVKNGVDIVYTVTEEAVDGYTTEINGFDITNKYIPEVTEVAGTKTWDDANNQDGKRPEKITVNLLADGTQVKTAEVKADADGNWKYSFTGLPKYKDGVEIVYTVTEEAVDGYTTEINGFDITNKYTPDVTEVNGTKTWDDANNQDGKRPEKITVNLLADGTQVKTAEVKADADGNWKYSFSGLPKFKDGKEIKYSVTENTVEGYTTEINGFNIKNIYKPGMTSVTVTKRWDDSDNKDRIRPTSIKVQLYADGKKVGDEIVLKAADQWTYTWKELPAMKNGKTIKYTVKEVGKVAGYTASVNDKNHGNIIITNSHKPNRPPVPSTGDGTGLTVFAAGLALAMVAFIGAIVARKKIGER